MERCSSKDRTTKPILRLPSDVAGDLCSLNGNGPSRSWVSASSTIPSVSVIVSRTSSSRCGVGVKISSNLDLSRVLRRALDLEFPLESEINASLSRAWRAGLYWLWLGVSAACFSGRKKWGQKHERRLRGVKWGWRWIGDGSRERHSFKGVFTGVYVSSVSPPTRNAPTFNVKIFIYPKMNPREGTLIFTSFAIRQVQVLVIIF